MHGGTQRGGQGRALRGDLRHGIQAFSHRLQHRRWRRKEEETGNGRQEGGRGGRAGGGEGKGKGLHGLELGAFGCGFRWKRLRFGFMGSAGMSGGAAASRFGGGNYLRLAEVKDRALMG